MSEPQPKKIAIDIDSTLHDYWPIFSRIAKRRFGIELAYESQRDWAVNLLRPEQSAVVIEESHSDENVLGAVPYENSVDAVNRWAKAGHWIHITSHRSVDAYDASARWLAQEGYVYDDLYCSYDKITRCVELGVDLLIDDSPVNIAKALEVGITPATLVHPWNRDICEEEGVLCAADWMGLSALLDQRLMPRATAGS